MPIAAGIGVSEGEDRGRKSRACLKCRFLGKLWPQWVGIWEWGSKSFILEHPSGKLTHKLQQLQQKIQIMLIFQKLLALIIWFNTSFFKTGSHCDVRCYITHWLWTFKDLSLSNAINLGSTDFFLCSPGCLQLTMPYAAEDDLELLTLPLPPLQCWGKWA